MTKLEIHNPFNAPVYHEETVTSTMDISRLLAESGEPHGTVITADFQQAGRGRIRDRTWEMDRKLSLPFTVLLRYPYIENIPKALTLRAGLAASFAIEDFMPELQNMVMLKWPNDVMIGTKKAAGILCEADGGNVHLGIGINVSQKEFPGSLKEKATSIALAAGITTGGDIAEEGRFLLLEKVLARLFEQLETEEGKNRQYCLQNRLQERLYKRGEKVAFAEGAAGSGNIIEGRLEGIGPGGELLIVPAGGDKSRSFLTGELILY